MKNFEQYIQSVRKYIDTDPLLILPTEERRIMPSDNGSLLFTLESGELERRLKDLGFELLPTSTFPSIQERRETSWSQMPTPNYLRLIGKYQLRDRSTQVNLSETEEPGIVKIYKFRDEVSVYPQGDQIGEFKVKSELGIHPYGREIVRFNDQELQRMKSFYTENADKIVDERTIKEITRYCNFTERYRAFAEEFQMLLRKFAEYPEPILYKNMKSPEIIALHNFTLP